MRPNLQPKENKMFKYLKPLALVFAGVLGTIGFAYIYTLLTDD